MTNGQTSACLWSLSALPFWGHWQRVRKELLEVHAKFKEKDFLSQPSDMCSEKRIPSFAPDWSYGNMRRATVKAWPLPSPPHVRGTMWTSAVITCPALSRLYRRHRLINARHSDVTHRKVKLTACNPLRKHQMLSTTLKHTKHSCAVVDPRGNINYHLDEMDSSQIRGN